MDSLVPVPRPDTIQGEAVRALVREADGRLADGEGGVNFGSQPFYPQSPSA
jgi:hypothetical protein